MIDREYRASQRKRRLKMQRIRAAVIFVVSVVLIILIMFVTPLFNIKNISVSGNLVVSLDQINACIGDVVGKNLFSTWNSTVEKRLKSIAYIEEVEVGKALIPPTLYVNIKECDIAAYFEIDGKQVIINSDLKVLDDSNTFSLDGVPLVRGIDIPNHEVGRYLSSKEGEKLQALSVFLKTMAEVEELSGVLYFDLTSITDLKFNYGGTLDVYCGSILELDKKLRMFKAVMTSGSIKSDAKGTLDLTNPEKAIHNP